MRLKLLMILIFGGIFSGFFPGCQFKKQKQSLAEINPSNLPVQLEVDGTISGYSSDCFKMIDIDGDGQSEIATIGRTTGRGEAQPNFVTVANYETDEAYFQQNFSGDINWVGGLDINEDGSQELIVSEKISNQVFLHIFNDRQKRLNYFLVAENKNSSVQEWDCSVQPVGLLDADGNGIQDLLVKIHTGEEFQPRGLAAFNLSTNQPVWTYPTGTVVSKPVIKDLDGDGISEIVVKTEAPGNGEGRIINGTDDSHSYLMILNERGKVLVQKQMGNSQSSVCPFVKDMDQKSPPEIVCLQTSRKTKPRSQNLISFWDFKNRRTYFPFAYDKQLVDLLAFTDLEHQCGEFEFLVMWIDGEIEVRNLQNQVVKSINLGERPMWLIQANINNNGTDEIIIASSNALYLFSDQLELQAKMEISLKEKPQIVDCGLNEPKMLFLTSDAHKFYWVKIRESSEWLFHVSWPYILSLILGLAVGLGGMWFYFSSKNNYLNSFSLLEYAEDLKSGFILIDQKGIILKINKRARQILQVDELKIDHRSFAEGFAELVHEPFRKIIRQSLAGETTRWKHQLAISQNDKIRDVAAAIYPVRDSRKNQIGLFVLLDDITAMSTSQRAIAWAALAQRLAHQIKTPLSSVTMAAQRLQMEYKRDEVEKAVVYDRYVDYVINEARRLKQITDGFMKLAQLEKPEFSQLNIHEIINEVLEKLQNHLPKQVSIQTNFAIDLPPVNIDENQIQMAIQFLVENSIQAVGESGSVEISTQLVQTLPTEFQTFTSDFVRIEIADTGKGIPSDLLPKLFEPFYTTKSHGTGLGLTIVKKIIEDHRGSIEVKSEVEMGTVVVVHLPVRSA